MPGTNINAYVIEIEDILKQEERAKTIPRPKFILKKKKKKDGTRGPWGINGNNKGVDCSYCSS